MNDELKDQRIGNLRAAILAARDALWTQGGFDNFALQLDRVLKEDARLAEQAPSATGEQLRELATSHRNTASKALCALLKPVLPGIESGALHDFSQAFIDEIVAAAGYEAEGRIRLRSQT